MDTYRMKMLRGGNAIEGAGHVETARESGYIPGKALEIARFVWGNIPRLMIEQNFGCSIQLKDLSVIRERMVAIGSHMVEAARTSPTTRCNGSYEATQQYYMNEKYRHHGGIFFFTRKRRTPPGLLKVHEIIHGAVGNEKRGVPVPGFLLVETQNGNISLLYEEIYVILLWEFGRSQVRNAQSFEDALANLYAGAKRQLRGVADDEARREGKSVEKAVRTFDALWDKMQKNPEPKFMERARLIYDERKKGNRRVSLNQFMEMTENVKPLV